MSEWVQKPLGELAVIRVSSVDKKSSSSELPIRLCNYMDVYAGTYLDDEMNYMEATASTREISNFTLRSGDVLITKDSESPDDIGIPAIIDKTSGGLVCGYHLAVLRPNPSKIDPLFLLKQMETDSVRRFYLKRAAGSTRYALATGTIEATPIKVAPLDHQKAIGRVLRALDIQIDTTKALIAKQVRVQAGLMHDLFTRGLDEHGQLRPAREEAPHLYHQTELGWLPKGWEISPINDMITAARAGCSVNSLGRPAFADEAGILKTSCVANGSFDAGENKAVEPCEYTRLREPVVQGSIIVSRMNTPDLVGESGLVGLAAPSLYLPDRLWQLHPKSSVNSYWLSRLLQFHNVKERIKALSTGTSGTMKNIDKAKFLSLLIPKPLITEMGQLASALNPIENSRMMLETELTKLQFQKSGLMQDLLTGRVSVVPLLEGVAE